MSCSPDFGVLCKETIDGLKNAFCEMPKIYKAFYLSCPPKCGEDQFELMRIAYFVHWWIGVISWILLVIISSSLGAPFNVMGVISFILSILCLWWVLTIAKHPEMCCCSQFVNALLFAIVAVLLAVLAVLGILGSFSLTSLQGCDGCGAFAVPGILYIWDCTVLVPLAVFAVNSTLAANKAAAKPIEPVKSPA